MQVVTNANMLDLIQNRSVPEFVPPKAEAPVTEAKVEAKPEVKAEPLANASEQEQARGPDGKFVKAEETQQVEKATQVADDEDADLPERVRRIIGKKHRALKEAEEFARTRDNDAAVAQAEAARLARELAELRKSGPQQEGKPEAKADGEPNPEDFKTVAEYTKALVKFEAAQARIQAEQDGAKRQQQSAVERAQSEYVARLDQVRSDIPDFDEVVSAADHELPAHVAQYIASAKNGPLVGYHLAKNPEVIQQLAKLPSIEAWAEMGAIGKSMATKPAKTQEVPVLSKAPSPITPLKGEAAPVNKDPATMTFAELRAHREAERASGKYR